MSKSRFHVLKHIIAQHKYQLLLTYTLFTIEMVGLLLRPYFLGKAVDGLIAGNYRGLVYLAASHFVWLVAGTIRHSYDTRTYTAIYTTLVKGLLAKKYGKEEVSKLSAHSTLAREFVDFLEFDLNYVAEAAYNLLGSLAMLFFYNKKVVLICLVILVPVMIASYFYGKRMQRLTLEKNDELEKQVEIISTHNLSAIAAHYASLRKWQVKISDNEAWNFGFMELMVLVVIVLSLLVTINGTAHVAVMPGAIIGIYNYVLKFATGLDTIPYTVQRLTSLKDISGRISFDDIEE
ncbi:ABC transporter six-transmembrane domain-containing protein [Parasediminibacterium sp. JCM 36343]|uniref:ABC transporter six-transmembrane domain-containing protein n=1 Tax=Parasediminibacterium sp. JCM 36343 TaxID=3374279 RepID=UPI00397C2B85